MGADVLYRDVVLGGSCLADRGEAVFQGAGGQVLVRLLEDAGGQVWAVPVDRFVREFERVDESGGDSSGS